MMNGLGSSDAPFAPASMASSQIEQLWNSDYSAAGLHSHLFCHQDPTMEDLSTSLRFFPLAEYPYSPLGLVLKREDNIAGAAGQIGLNLGKRAYFSSSSSGDYTRHLVLRPKGGDGGGVWSPRHQPSSCQCQAEGCKSDLSGAKHYHRRHKICDFHSKATVVIAHGLQQRFCQQCSRFHVLEEFDEAKRSCRKSLANHNRRRRKPRMKHDADCSTSTITPTGTSGMIGQGDHLKDEAAVSQMRRQQPQQQQPQQSQPQPQLPPQRFSSLAHHQNTWSSAPNEASVSMGGGPPSYLQLDGTMFELDFMLDLI